MPSKKQQDQTLIAIEKMEDSELIEFCLSNMHETRAVKEALRVRLNSLLPKKLAKGPAPTYRPTILNLLSTPRAARVGMKRVKLVEYALLEHKTGNRNAIYLAISKLITEGLVIESQGMLFSTEFNSFHR